MKTLVLEKPGDLRAVETPDPGRPGPGMALVRVWRAGVCGTDVHAYHGRQPFFTYPRILGHELGVEIVALGDNDRDLRPGDHCAVEPYINCGQCIACRRGKPTCCVNMSVLGVHRDGGMREYFHVPARKLHVATRLSFDQLALVETLAIGAHAGARPQLEAGEWALVVGAGPIGLSVIQFAKAAGARVVVSDVNAVRLEFCRAQLGIEHCVNATGPELVSRLRDLTGGDMPTAVFDATGNPHSMMASFEYPAHGGRLVFVGLFPGEVTFHDPSFHRRELTLLATRNALPEDFTRIIALVESGQVDTRPWITHRAPFDAMPAEFSNWARTDSGVLKAIIEFGA